MEEDILKEAKERREKYLEEKLEKRKNGLGDRKHLFIWTKRIINILNKKGKQTVEQISSNLLDDFPEDYGKLSDDEMNGSVNSTLHSLIKKQKLENIRGVKSNLIYGFGFVLKNNGLYWWIESLKEKQEVTMQKILDLFKH